MGTPLTAATITERWQALQQLEAAYGQPDGNMFFTYNGVTYRSVGVNPNGTMEVINQTTGQATSLDPINVYSSAMAVTGNTVQTAPTVISQGGASASQQPSSMTNVMQQIGMYSGFVNMAAQIKGLGHFLSGIPQFSMVLGSLTAFLSTYSAFQGIQNLYKNGFSLMGMVGVLGSAFGIATGVNAMILNSMGFSSMTGMGAWGSALMNPAGWAIAGAVVGGSILYGSINSMITNGVTPGTVAAAAGAAIGTVIAVNLAIAAIHATAAAAAAAAGTALPSLSSLLTTGLLTGPWGWIAVAAIVAFAIIWSLLHQPPPEQVAAQNLSQAISPVIWTPGPLTVVAVGTVAILMGWAKTQAPPAMASLTVPAYYVNQVLKNQGVPAMNLNSNTPSVITEPGDGEVVIVSKTGTDSHGNPLVTLQTYSVAKNLQFISSQDAPPEGSYIPFFDFVNGKLQTKPSAAVLNALTIQDRMLQAVLSGTLYTHDALNALNIAAAANKIGVSPSN